ncbi:hypothetical protein CS345_14905 [Bordetella bronchiseptica]|nr:hypothetical protein CS345_14905 [Bordetella bronchiseptica]BAO70083.1 hypothetical protein BBS798_3358 [Bordetella bronchiseptica]
MIVVHTFDGSDGDYRSPRPGYPFGMRVRADRRYWLAWACAGKRTPSDCLPGVMDDFGTLVPVPAPVFSEA